MKTLRMTAAIAVCASTFVGLSAGAQASTDTNPTPIVIPTSGVGTADPYPSTIQVSQFPGNLVQARVTLHGITHGFPRDLDIMLVGPTGKSTMLMSDACDQAPTDLANATVTFDDFAARPMPDVTPDTAPACPSGTYQTTDWEPENPAEEPPPAPAKTGLANLSVFAGESPNGNWSLYVADDTPPFIFPEPPASIAGGWTLELLASGVCAGKRVTVPSHIGTDASETITGTRGPDVIMGNGGNDVIRGLGGKDRICGTTGNDRLFGGPGKDLILGQKGSDRLSGQKGKDICVGGPKRDRQKGCELIARI